MKKPHVIITSGYRWHYFQWFLLGLFELERENKIKVSFNLPLGSKFLFLTDMNITRKIGDFLRRRFEDDSYCMEGVIKYPNGSHKRFVIDSADSPFLFEHDKLKKDDIYFKMQCPKDFNEEGFRLTDEIIIPWCDHAHVDDLPLTARGKRKEFDIKPYVDRIKPLMIGPRALSENGYTYKHLKQGYDNYVKDRQYKKIKHIMCYFGNSYGPLPEEYTKTPDYDWERDILGSYGDLVNHPNEKRGKVSEIINELPNCDGRVISNSNSDVLDAVKRKELEVPLKDFCRFISDFDFNVNVSGYRLSIPNRFIESFMVGTAIITDKLSVKWYLPFDEEVIESVEMGYLPNDCVDWDGFRNDLSSLGSSNASKVVENYEQKWAPRSVACYILETLKKS